MVYVRIIPGRPTFFLYGVSINGDIPIAGWSIRENPIKIRMRTGVPRFFLCFFFQMSELSWTSRTWFSHQIHEFFLTYWSCSKLINRMLYSSILKNELGEDHSNVTQLWSLLASVFCQSALMLCTHVFACAWGGISVEPVIRGYLQSSSY